MLALGPGFTPVELRDKAQEDKHVILLYDILILLPKPMVSSDTAGRISQRGSQSLMGRGLFCSSYSPMSLQDTHKRVAEGSESDKDRDGGGRKGGRERD